MKTMSRFTGVLFAACMTFASLPAANAQLISTNTSSLSGPLSVFDYQPIANLAVGGTNVLADHFSVFGQATGAANLSFVLFDRSASPAADGYSIAAIWQSGVQSVTAASAHWYDSPTIPVAFSTLLANNTYSMGVVANGNFLWGQSTVGIDTLAGQLTIPFQTAGTYIVDGTSLTAAVDVYADTAGIQTSLRVFGSADAPAPPVPEPAEWTMLLAGLMVVSFVANRQRKHRV